MRSLVILYSALSFVTAYAKEVPCSFFVSSATLFEGWRINQGRAEIKSSNGQFSARLFGDSEDSEPTHTLKGSIISGHVTATIAIQHSDAVPQRLAGSYVKENDPYSGFPPKIFESFLAHDGTLAIGIKCYGETPVLTRRLTYPVEKPARPR